MRLRITFAKSGALRYTGHLDLQTTWERTVRRAGLPLAYTQGFHPGPRVQIASALPLGFLGRAEIVDIWLQENTGTALDEDHSHSYLDLLQPAAPPGLTIVSVESVDESGPALQTQVSSAEYQVTLLDPVDEKELARRLAETLKVDSLIRQRRGKTYDLRPLIEELSINFSSPVPSTSTRNHRLTSDTDVRADRAGEQDIRIFMRLAARDGATARPEEVMDVLGIPFESTRIERTRLILKSEME
jgi:radical SAM-linked protein